MAETTTEILQTEDRRTERAHRYRRTTRGTAGEYTQEGWASEPVPPVSREVLEDRYAEIMGRGNASKLLLRLDRILQQIGARLTARVWDTEDGTSVPIYINGDVQMLDEIMDVDGCEAMIREWMLERAAKAAIR